MARQSFNTILEECITLLRQGKTVLDCQKIYGKSQALANALEVVAIGLRIPKKDTVLDDKAIWLKISKHIKLPKKETFHGYSVNPFANLRFSFPRPVVSLIMLLVIIGLVNTTAVAAQNSIPGQTLYPVKKTVEKIHLTLTINDEKKTEVRIKHAESRLSEVASIVENKSNGEPITELNQKDAESVEATLNELIETTVKISSEGDKNKSPDLLEKIVNLADKQELVLNQLGTKLSGDTKDAINSALGSAQASENTARKILEILKENSAITNSNATSTEAALTIPSTTTTSTIPGLPTTTPTTTEEIEALGDADATSTKEIEPADGSDNQSTTTNPSLQIIEF